ncbi:hypothetical protein VTN77DRAFT_2537 [Rasamsonia byssochlamydoides]|uniref:uncharacterized protein n=1 Tax=Rasamsonia byssochlamydoides TaxID=89139 RepID=UPI003742A6DD
MSSYALLDQAEEDGLHKFRLLNVEEKPFKRITKRLLARDSLILNPPTLPPTPPPEGTDADAAAAAEAERQKKLEEWRQFKEDVTLDFAAFESSIARIQFLLTSNEKERERYAAEKLRIQQTAQEVRDNTAELRIQLEAAQKTLALRKTYDDLAEKITSNRLLRPREDQLANLEKLRAEILDLEKESREYAKTWSERREQFGRIVEEGMQLRRLIRDEKEEVERREGMQEGGEGEAGEGSSVNTPRPDAETQPSVDESTTASAAGSLQVEKPQTETRATSPLRQSMTTSDEKTEEDVNMADEGEVTDKAEGDELEEGEEISDNRGEKMDTS